MIGPTKLIPIVVIGSVSAFLVFKLLQDLLFYRAPDKTNAQGTENGETSLNARGGDHSQGDGGGASC